MGIDITQKPEMNVVNVGDEVTSDQIAAIQNAAAPTAANPFATIADVGGNPFDQSLNTTDSPSFYGVEIGNPTEGGNTIFINGSEGISLSGSWSTGISSTGAYFSLCGLDDGSGLYFSNGSGLGITFADGSYQSTAGGGGGGNPFDQNLNTTDNVIFNKIDLGSGMATMTIDPYWIGTGFQHQVAGFTANLRGVAGFEHTNGTQYARFGVNSGLEFPDGSIQSTAASAGIEGTVNPVIDNGAWQIADYALQPNDYAVAGNAGTNSVYVDQLTVGQTAYVVCSNDDLANVTYVQTNAANNVVYYGNWTTSGALESGQIAKVVCVASGVYHVIRIS